jgi:coenzyme F420-0:L-glutamate ligase/coenzyme F420-1:gamma-L-glutamate ligase
MTLSVWAPEGVPEIVEGSDLAALLLAATDLADGDIVAVTSKVVSKAEGRIVDGDRDDWLESETIHVVARRGPTSIVRNRLGLTLAAAGIDASNVAPGRLVLLPIDPDGSARRLRSAVRAATDCNVAVIVTDTAGRAWRVGQTDIAIGAAGLRVSVDHAGEVDGYGNPLSVTMPAVADELAGAAELAQGKLTGRPFAVIRGRADLVLAADDDGPGAVALVRAEADDLFGYGAREAVVRAVAGDRRDLPPYGGKATREELEEALARVPHAGRDGVRAIAFAHGWTAADLESAGLPRSRPAVP